MIQYWNVPIIITVSLKITNSYSYDSIIYSNNLRIVSFTLYNTVMCHMEHIKINDIVHTESSLIFLKDPVSSLHSCMPLNDEIYVLQFCILFLFGNQFSEIINIRFPSVQMTWEPCIN